MGGTVNILENIPMTLFSEDIKYSHLDWVTVMYMGTMSFFMNSIFLIRSLNKMRGSSHTGLF